MRRFTIVAMDSDTDVNQVTFNPLDPRLVEDPYPVYRQVRESDPVHFEEMFGWWFVMSHQEATTTLREPGGDLRFVEFQHARMGRDMTDEPYCRGLRDFVLMKGGEDHKRVRRSFNRLFTPARVNAMRDQMLATANDLLDRLPNQGTADLMEVFAMPLPLSIISRLLNVSPDDERNIDGLLKHFKLAIQFLPMTDEQLAQANASIGGLTEYFANMITERRKNMSDDLLSMLIEEADAGDLTEDELVANAWGLYGGGHETTANTMCTAILTLLQHPDQLDMLRNDPSLIPQTVDEVLRYCGPTQATHRIFDHEIELGGHTIPADTPIVVYLASANHDESWCPHADRFDITRTEPKSHLTFSEGPHKCVGRHLAKVTLEVALEALVSRLEGLRLAGEVEWDKENLPFRAPTGLVVTWDRVLQADRA